jgi:hypothetical protein
VRTSSRARKSSAGARYAPFHRRAPNPAGISCPETAATRRAAGGTPFAFCLVDFVVPGGAVVQQVVHSVFVTVVSVVATLITVGLTGIIILLATNGDTPHAESRGPVTTATRRTPKRAAAATDPVPISV